MYILHADAFSFVALVETILNKFCYLHAAAPSNSSLRDSKGYTTFKKCTHCAFNDPSILE